METCVEGGGQGRLQVRDCEYCRLECDGYWRSGSQVPDLLTYPQVLAPFWQRRCTLVGCQYGRNDTWVRHSEKLLGKGEVVKKKQNAPELSHLIIWATFNLIK